MRLVIKEIWSPDLDPPSEGLPPNAEHFSVFVQVAVGEDTPGSEVFHFTAASPDAERTGSSIPVLFLERFDWERIDSWVQRQLDVVSATTRTWDEVIAKLAPVMEYSDRDQPSVTTPVTEEDRARLVAGWIEHRSRFLRDLPRFEEMQAAHRKALLRSSIKAVLMPWKRDGIMKALAGRLQDEMTTLPSTETMPASQRVDEIIGRGDDNSWALLMALVRAVPEELLGQLGAGPAEVFFDEATVKRFSAAIREALAGEPRFRTVLEAAWNLPEELQEMLAKTS